MWKKIVLGVLVLIVVVITVAVIFIPMLLDGPPPAPEPVALETIPPRPDAGFVPKRIDLDVPERPADATPPPAPTVATAADAAPPPPGSAWAGTARSTHVVSVAATIAGAAAMDGPLGATRWRGS